MLFRAGLWLGRLRPALHLYIFISLVAFSRDVAAEEEVRIAISGGKTELSIEGSDLRVFDGDVGDRLATSIGLTKVKVKARNKKIRVTGSRLSLENSKQILTKKVFFI